ncbi:MAG TPA: glycosyltransferase, partial [Candidatus Bilamarchaeaceae archaeon]|nr:glycosyltransferase [Candidatus Bilamarchaeaceae archaeon]
MRDCELVVFPSLFEAFPAVALEAMACGAAIIASDIPSFREALDDTAVYFTKGDEKDLAGKIERTLQEGRLRSRLGRAAVERSKNYDFSFGIGKYVELYKSIME